MLESIVLSLWPAGFDAGKCLGRHRNKPKKHSLPKLTGQANGRAIQAQVLSFLELITGLNQLKKRIDAINL